MKFQELSLITFDSLHHIVFVHLVLLTHQLQQLDEVLFESRVDETIVICRPVLFVQVFKVSRECYLCHISILYVMIINIDHAVLWLHAHRSWEQIDPLVQLITDAAW